MRHLLPCAALVLAGLAPAALHAQAPETLLPAGACCYVRFDGMANHRDAYDKSAFAEIMRGDLGQFLGHVWSLVEKEKSNKDSLDVIRKVGKVILENGGHLAIEVAPHKDQTHWYATIVIPNDAADGKPGIVQRCLEEAMERDKTKKVQRDGITYQYGVDQHSVCWWSQGGHFVLAISTERVPAVLQRNKKRGGNITQHPLYKDIDGKGLIAGFVDAKPLVDLCLSAVESPALLSSDDLGLADLRGLTYHAGFEGKAWRDTIKIHGAAERKGLLKIAGATRAVDLENLPPLPADATSVRVCAFDFAKISDEVIKTYQRLSKTYQEAQERDADAGKDEAASAWDAAKQFLESSIVKDIVGSLGPQVVTFNSPAEGPWVLGWGMAIQVQDTDRLGKILNVLDDGLRLADAFGVKNDFKLKKRKYHGVDLYTLHTTIDQPFSPSFVLHEGWLVVGLYPQVPQGYVLRCQEKIPRWQPAPEFEKAVASAQRKGVKVFSVAQDDHRQSLKFFLSLAPIVARMGSFLDSGFDPSFVPNAHAVTAAMFPSISVMTDDGKTWTRERRACLPIDLDIPSLYVAMGLGSSFGNLGFGMQSWVPEAGMTLPSANYLRHPPQYAPPKTPSVPAKPAEKPEDVAPAKNDSTPVRQPDWVEDHAEKRVPILPPIPPGGKPACEEPSNEEIHQALQRRVSNLIKESPEDVVINLEKLVDTVDAPRFFPLLGPAQVHRCRWKCTVSYPEKTNSGTRRGTQIIYLDKDRLHQWIADEGSGGGGTVVVQQTGGPLPAVNAIPLKEPKEPREKLIVKTYDLSSLVDKNNAEGSLKELRAAVQLVEPETWQAEGGVGSIVTITHRQQFVVRQTAAVHERIARLLAEVSETRSPRKCGSPYASVTVLIKAGVSKCERWG